MNSVLPPDTSGLVSWLATEAPSIEEPAALIRALCAHLRGVGVAVDRVTVGLQILHPLVRVVFWIWSVDTDRVETREFDQSIETMPIFTNSPIYELRKGTPMIRRRLVGPNASLDYPILHDLVVQGYTDYLGLALRFDQGQGNALTWATRKADGFDDRDLAMLRGLMPVFSLLMEVHAQRRLSRTILGTYLGREAGEQVLSGRIHRGDAATIRAVLWTSDIRGFTEMSDRYSRGEILQLLNAVFEAQVRAIQNKGGEVLKFMGDGLLAVFRASHEPEDAQRAVHASLEAARLAFTDLAEVNRERVARSQPKVNVGLALHLGDVEFGNIGAPDRLDFTVIGPAVNQASRMEGLCKVLGEPFLVSAEVARLAGPAERWGMRSLGNHGLRGVSEGVDLYTADMPVV